MTWDERLTGMFGVDSPFVYRRGDTLERCQEQLYGHRKYIMYDYYRLGEGSTGWGRQPGAVRCNIHSGYIPKGTVPDEYFLIEDVVEDGAEEQRGLEIDFLPGQVLYLNMVYNERFISKEGATALKAGFIETLYRMIREGA